MFLLIPQGVYIRGVKISELLIASFFLLFIYELRFPCFYLTVGYADVHNIQKLVGVSYSH